MGSLVIPLAVLIVVSLSIACDHSSIEEHSIPKGVEQMPARRVDATLAETKASDWIVPEGWMADPEPRPMRVATYVVPDALGNVEIAITRFPGRVGGELANINRWRGQMGLPLIVAADLELSLTRFGSPGYEGYQTRVESDAGVMLAVGVYDVATDQTWFVRTTVPEVDTADRLQDDLFGFAHSMAGLRGEDDG